ncbi:hypothetical protein BROUX41_003328 [Berkeleyomyces rouxiae]|uniref:uncharacterized protein n=1 Tax=Berkeleyomyces rouxiae TaxID=2035830 RepID=UPI003B76007E
MPDISAIYTSPTNDAFTLVESVAAPAFTSPTDKSTSLASLRTAVSALQDGINRELTIRMEEDNAKAKLAGAAVDDVKEEENYGEEVQEED